MLVKLKQGGAVWSLITSGQLCDMSLSSQVIVKTLIAVAPYVSHTYKSCIPENRDSAGFTCFDLLGFDILLDYR